MILRPAVPADAEALAALGRNSFCAAFEHLYRPEDLAQFLAETYAPEKVAAEIADPAITHRLAQDGEHEPLTGFIKLRAPSPYADHSDATRPIAIGQLYTDPARTGAGIGAMLMDWAMDHARKGGHDAVQLSVWSENTRAQAFYRRYGFSKIADIHFLVGAQVDDEFLFEARL